MTTPLSAAGPARHQGRPQIGAGQEPTAEPADHGSIPVQETAGARVREAAPSATPPHTTVPHKHAGPDSAADAEQNERGRPRQDGLRLGSETAPPHQDGPWRVDDDAGAHPYAGSEHSGVAIGPREHLAGGLQARDEARDEKKTPHIHASSSSISAPSALSTRSGAAATRRA